VMAAAPMPEEVAVGPVIDEIVVVAVPRHKESGKAGTRGRASVQLRGDAECARVDRQPVPLRSVEVDDDRVAAVGGG
jgi:hypothetical protein